MKWLNCSWRRLIFVAVLPMKTVKWMPVEAEGRNFSL